MRILKKNVGIVDFFTTGKIVLKKKILVGFFAYFEFIKVA
jgi:hypothetical protein